jgi:ornithine cyclodeaminase/alanine dehydrogenase-like protein (mu-crystallin family)
MARVIVDEWTQASHAGEINVPVSEGSFSKENLIGELGEIVTAKKKGRLNDSDITLFDSTGLAIQDVAVAQVIYKKALKLKKGRVLNLNG